MAMLEQDGVEEEDLIVWYLEQKENELESQEDLEMQRSLARKVLKRMIKVSSTTVEDAEDELLTCYCRIMCFFKFEEKVLQMMLVRISRRARGWSMSCILIVLWRRSEVC